MSPRQHPGMLDTSKGQGPLTKLSGGEVICSGDKTHLVASSAVPLAMGSQ